MTEAINSMFAWYKGLAVCFAYLADLSFSEDGSLCIDNLERCRWFSRAWTLQELVVPPKVEFYDRAWRFRGDTQLLQSQLSYITKIDAAIFEDSDLLTTSPVARRMSWASKRQTTRVEDLAYCLLGIFDVNMPLIYCEGKKAYLRLQ